MAKNNGLDRVEREGLAFMAAWRQLSNLAEYPDWGEVTLEALKVRLGHGFGAETLIILNGVDSDGTPVVAFHSATTVAHAFIGAMRKFEDGDLNWRADEWRINNARSSD
jgi:hypothetical protein